MNRTLVKFLYGVILAVSLQSRASDNRWLLEDYIELDVHSGWTQTTGHFSEQKNPSTYGFALNVYFQSKDRVSFPSYLSVGNYNFSMVSNDSSYIFPVDRSVLFSSNFLNLMLPVYSWDNIALYVGVGYTLISLFNDDEGKFNQTFGSMNYDFEVRYQLSSKWGIHYKTIWNQINQYQNNRYSFIEMWTHLFGVSYLIF